MSRAQPDKYLIEIVLSTLLFFQLVLADDLFGQASVVDEQLIFHAS
jgi:hypothetical protein